MHSCHACLLDNLTFEFFLLQKIMFKPGLDESPTLMVSSQSTISSGELYQISAVLLAKGKHTGIMLPSLAKT